MKNKSVFFVLLAIMLFVCFVSVSASDTGSTAEERFLNDLLALIYRNEILYGDMQWVLNAFERFDSERSWESLQLARASLTLARTEMTRLELPEMEMSFIDELELMDAGIDVSFMESAADEFYSNQKELSTACLNLHHKIMGGVFLNREWKNSMDYVDFLQKANDIYIQYYANMVDWSLATLNKDAVTSKMNGILAEYCPLIHAHQAEKLSTPESIEFAVNELLNELESLLVDNSKILSADTNLLYYLEDILESKDLSKLTEDLTVISGLPPVLEEPEWFDDEDIFYYWKENSEIQTSPVPGTALERIPDGCRIRMNDVTKEDFLAYISILENDGLSASETGNEDSKITVIYNYAESVFGMVWEDDSVTILMSENPIFFIPLWYFPAVRAANGFL